MLIAFGGSMKKMAVRDILIRRIGRLIPVLKNVSRAMSDSSPLPGETPSGGDKSTFFSGGMNYQANIARHSDKRGQTSVIADVDGQKIHYEHTGAGKHVVLLLPGALGSSLTDFQPQLMNFNKDLFSLIAWDPPGYGKSSSSGRQWETKFLHEDAKIAARLMETLDIQKYSLLGWSDGGITAMVMAATHPDRVKKLVIWGANAFVTKEETEMLRQIQDTNVWSERMKKPFISVYGEENFKKTWSEWVDAFLKNYYVESEGDICKGILSKIKCPTLIIHGQKDPIVAQFHPDFLHKEIAESRLVNLPDGKHNLHLRFYREFNSIVENFLIEQ